PGPDAAVVRGRDVVPATAGLSRAVPRHLLVVDLVVAVALRGRVDRQEERRAEDRRAALRAEQVRLPLGRGREVELEGALRVELDRLVAVPVGARVAAVVRVVGLVVLPGGDLAARQGGLEGRLLEAAGRLREGAGGGHCQDGRRADAGYEGLRMHAGTLGGRRCDAVAGALQPAGRVYPRGRRTGRRD